MGRQRRGWCDVQVRRLATIAVVGVAIVAATATGGVAHAAPLKQSGTVTMSWQLPIVTGLIQQEVAVYAQSPSMAAVDLQGADVQGVDQPGYTWEMPIYERGRAKEKAAGGVLLINVRTQSVVNLAYLTVHRDTRTISAIASFSTSGFQGRITVFSYGKGESDAVRGARLVLAKGMADRLNSALKSDIFTEGMTLGTLDVRLDRR